MIVSARPLFCMLLAAPLLLAPGSATLRGLRPEVARAEGDEAAAPLPGGAAPAPPARLLQPAPGGYGGYAPGAPPSTAPYYAPAPGNPPAAPQTPSAPPTVSNYAPAPSGTPPAAPRTPPAVPPTVSKPAPSTQQSRAQDISVEAGTAGWPVSASWNPPPAAAPLPDTHCELITPWSALASDAACPAALRAFVADTTEGAWSRQTLQQRENTMETFCKTSCGLTYTNTLTARRRGCNTPTPRGYGAAVVPDGPVAFPPMYPGLRLGCMVDPKDQQFCAVKRADPGAGDCQFYMSCCYGELAAQAAGLGFDRSFFGAIDQVCPGSAKYRKLRCFVEE